MSVLFLEYPKCSTCKKAKAWLEAAGVDFMDRHIVENNPTAEELKQWHAKSGLPLKKFFNTSGMLYKEMQLKDKLADIPLLQLPVHFIGDLAGKMMVQLLWYIYHQAVAPLF